jgi:hypothetical protein
MPDRLTRLPCERHELLVSGDALAAKLALPDHMRCFNAVVSGLGGMEGLEAHHGVGDFF